MAASARNVSLDSFLNGTVRVVENYGGVARLESRGEEGPSVVLEDDGGSGSDAINDGDFVDIISIDE